MAGTLTALQIEKRREAGRRYRAAHKDKVAASRKRWRDNRTEAQREAQRLSHKRYMDRKRVSPDFRSAEAAYMRLLRARRSGRDIDTRPPIGEELKRILGQNALYVAASAAVPAHYPQHVRDDVIGEIVLAVLEGFIDENEIAARAKDFVSSYWRQRDLWQTLSLDAPIPGHDKGTYIDRLVDPTTVEA